MQKNLCALVAQSEEHVLGKDGVTGSTPVKGSMAYKTGGKNGKGKI